MKRKAKDHVRAEKAADVVFVSNPSEEKKKKKKKPSESVVQSSSTTTTTSTSTSHDEVLKKVVSSPKDRKRSPKASNSDQKLVTLSSPKEESSPIRPVTRSPVQSPPKRGAALPIVPVSPNQVQIFVHRFRSPHHIPRAILRLAATPYAPGDLSYIALSREGGAVELISVDEHYKCVGIVEGLKDRHVDALTWIGGGDRCSHFTARRLVGASRDGTIFEVDFCTKSHRHVMASGGGAIFCLASLFTDAGSAYIAAGCEDGTIRIYQVNAHDMDDRESGFTMVTILPSAGSAVLSLAWAKHTRAIVAGMADGTIRKYDSSSSSSSSSQATGKQKIHVQATPWQFTPSLRITVEGRGRSVPTKIWAVLLLDDGTIVSGDSLGHVQFWDGNIGTMIQSIEHSKADVLDLAISHDQTKVMACGIDPKIICIARDTEAAASGTGSKRNWIVINQMRRHSHDVHSLAIAYQSDTSGCALMAPNANTGTMKPRELLYSGGADTKLCSYFVADMRKLRPRVVYKYPAAPNISLAKIPRIITIMRDDRIDFFKLADKGTKPTLLPTDSKVLNSLISSSIGSVVISSMYNLSCSDISNDGTVLAVGNTAGLLLFSIDYTPAGSITYTAIPSRDALNFPCTLIKFIPGSDKRFACFTNLGGIRIIKIEEISHRNKGVTRDAIQEYSVVADKRNELVSYSAVSTDGKWLASASYDTPSGIVRVFSTTVGCHRWWTLPPTEAPISCLKFLGGNKACPALFVGCNNYAFYIYDIERKVLSDFSQDLGFPMSPLLPAELNHHMDCPSYVAQNPAKVNQFLMGDASLFCAIDLDSPMPQHCPVYPTNHILAKRLRKQMSDDQSEVANSEVDDNGNQDKKRKNNFTLCLKYSGIIFMEFLDEDELLIVEQPWLAILNALPDVLERKRYGD